MKNIVFPLLLTALFLGAAPRGVQAFDNTAHPLGAGVSLGSPNTLTAKYYLNESMALQAGLGLPGFFSFGIVGTMDLVFEIRDVVDVNAPEFNLFPYIGVGGQFSYAINCWTYWGGRNCNNTTRVGGRVPIGLGMHLTDEPIELTLQVAPGMVIRNRDWDASDPSLRPTLDVNLAFRYYF